MRFRISGLFALVVVAYLFSATELLGQSDVQWSREQFTSENGLLQNRVHAMEVDAHGNLLIGTEGGLVRYDGEVFRQVGVQGAGGIQPSRVLDIISLPDLSFVVRDASCRQYLYKDNHVAALNMDAPARRPASRFAGSGISQRVVVAAMDPDSILPGKADWPYGVRMIDLSGGRWCVRREQEILLYKDSSLLKRIAVPPGRWSHIFEMSGYLFTLDSIGGAYRVDVDRGTFVRIAIAGFPQVTDQEGKRAWSLRWQPSQDKLGIVADDAFYDIRSSASGDSLIGVRLQIDLPTECKIGAVAWLNGGRVIAIGTDTKGLYIYRQNSMRTLTCDGGANGVNNVYTSQAIYGRNGVVTSVQGVVREFTEAGCDQLTKPLPPFDDVAITLDQAQRYWYGRDDSLFVYDPATGVERLMRKGLKPMCFTEDGMAMWVGASNGIYRIRNDSITLVAPVDQTDLSFRPRALSYVAGQGLWMATCSGVYRWGPRGGWVVVPGLEGVCARSMALVDGNLLIGTYGSGAFLYADGKLHAMPQDAQGFLSHVHAFMPDRAGYLWMSTNQGLFRLRRSDLEAWSRDTTMGVYMAYYGKNAGILNPEFNGGCDPAYVRTLDGWASFPTMDGLVWFKPEEVPDAYPEESLQIEDVLVDGTARDWAKEISVDWKAKDVVIRFSLAYWGDPENAKLEYALGETENVHWLPIPRGQRELHLGGLPSGNLMLSMRKVGAATRGDKERLQIRFMVPVPFYRSIWFIALCVISAALAFGLMLRFNAARLRRKNMQLENKVRERTAELVDANAVLRHSLEVKEMLVSIISHDIVTPLRFIARVAQGASRRLEPQVDDQLSGTLKDLARSSDKLHANAQDLLHWIKRQDGRIEMRPRMVRLHDLVEEVLAMEQERARERGVGLFNRVLPEDELHMDSDVFTIVLKNLVANAITHTAPGRVTISGEQAKSHYRIMVEDTGNGMGEAALLHAQRVQSKGALGAMNHEGERDVQGLGLLIVADLLELMHGEFRIDSTPGKGTVITVSLPREPRTTPLLHRSNGNGAA